MWALLLPILAQLGGKLGDYFKQKNDIQMQQLETQRQIEVAKQQMAADIAKAQMELNKTMVAATGTYFKYFTFVMWFGPFMLGVVWPSKSAEIFTNLSSMPEWYVQSCMLIMFTVWGISVGAPVVGNIFSGLSTFMTERRERRERREYRLEKARINRSAMFEALKKEGLFKGTQSEVAKYDRAMDAGENE
jgi:hypothetical protein